jgi:hypothetical protein
MLYRPSDGIQDQEVFRELLRISQVFTFLDKGSIRVLHAAPEKPSDGDTAICDGGDWNPLGDGIKRPIWFNETTGLWEAF